MNYLIHMVEIALLIILPLILFYQRSNWIYKNYILNIVLLYIIWYVTYALLHELCHMLGVWMTGKKILDYQLIPKIWISDFRTGYVNYNFNSDSRDFVIIIMPYVRDIIFLLIGFIILRKKIIKNSFVIGLILILLILNPLYDIIDNYSAYLFGALNDFNALKMTSSNFISNFVGISFSLIAIITTLLIFKLYKGYPVKNQIEMR
jgi:hypothetical protein